MDKEWLANGHTAHQNVPRLVISAWPNTTWDEQKREKLPYAYLTDTAAAYVSSLRTSTLALLIAMDLPLHECVALYVELTMVKPRLFAYVMSSSDEKV